MSESAWTSDELMAVMAARALPDGVVCFVGIGVPSLAANLARRLHAPSLVLVYESGPIGARPRRPPLSIGDGELAETADVVVSVPDMFEQWLLPGRIDIGFLGAAQIDRYANLNSTVIGDYDRPQVRLPGAGGAPEIAAACGQVIVALRHRPRAFVPQVDFVTTFGLRRGDVSRADLGLPGLGPTTVVTDLGILRPNNAGELVLAAVAPGVDASRVRAATGWDLLIADELEAIEPPAPEELDALRDLTAA